MPTDSQIRAKHFHYRRDRGVEGWGDDGQAVIFPEQCLLVDHAYFDVVDALYVREIGMDAKVCKCPVLTYRLILQIRRSQVCERIAAWKIVISIFSNIGAEVEDRI
jgi:hypothetical protein